MFQITRVLPTMAPSFENMVALLVGAGVHNCRLEIWRDKLQSLGASLEEHVTRRLTHVFASSEAALQDRIDSTRLNRLMKLQVTFLTFEWLEDSLKAGHELPTEPYRVHPAEENVCVQTVCGKRPFVESSDPKDQDTEIYAPPNLNKHITEPFEELGRIYKYAFGDERRWYSYHKAISILEKLPFRVNEMDQVKDVQGIGKSMQNQIRELLSFGKLSKLEHLRNDEKVKTVTMFGSIVWGVGRSSALKLYDKGHRSLNDLVGEVTLKRCQQVGLEFSDDINMKIPRNEVKVMEELVREAAEAIQPGISVVCAGSYRRCKAFVGDLDIIVTHPDGTSHKGVLQRLISALKAMKFLTEDLTKGIHEGLDAVDTYFGLCKYPDREQRHRIDIKVFSWQQYPFALIHWTGNDILNRRLRTEARAKGYLLDEKGLYIRPRDGESKRLKSASIPCNTERQVFEFIGFPWLEPHERNL